MSNPREQPTLIDGKRILLGVTGSIAAYKAVELLRKLQEHGAVVRVVMTKHAANFVAPLTFETLTRQHVLIDEFTGASAGAIGHIELTDELDAAIIAPATANSIGKLSSGIADDALTSTIMALKCPLIVAPAMNTRMYRNPVLQRNISALRSYGIRIVEPGTGSLACGSAGQGRLADPDQILTAVESIFLKKELAGKNVLVTAGPTREAIDAVRFITNPSTGKMGYALAVAARERGAEVVLISGPAHLPPPTDVAVIPVTSAAEMRAEVLDRCRDCDIVIMAAAVSDFRPAHVETRKIKKEEAADTIRLERTDDILSELGSMDGRRMLVGFAAETDDVERNALAKLKAKNLDMIVANDLTQEGSGFGTDTNAVICFDRYGAKTVYPCMQKNELARVLLDDMIALLQRTGAL